MTLFDAGARTMVRAVASAGGQARRHQADRARPRPHRPPRHRARARACPCCCHPDEVQDAEGSGGFRYWPEGLVGPADSPAPDPPRAAPLGVGRRAGEDRGHGRRRAMRWRASAWSHMPGHAPGQIALWRESDRLALVSDCFYTLEMWGRDCPPHLPDAIYNYDTEQARASMLQAGGAGAGGGLAGTRQAGDRRRARAAGARPRSDRRLRREARQSAAAQERAQAAGEADRADQRLHATPRATC